MEKRQVSWLTAFILGGTLLAGCATNPSQTTCAPKPGDENFFPIIAWDGGRPIPDDVPSLPIFKDMVECGITVAGFYPPEKLDEIAEAGLVTYVRDPRGNNHDLFDPAAYDSVKTRQEIRELISEVNDHPAVYGYYIKDEPHEVLFPMLADMTEEYRTSAPDKEIYINLLPGKPGMEHETYIDRFLTQCPVKTVGYDYYAFLESQPEELRPWFWGNLRMMRTAAKNHNKPFFAVVLSNAHFSYRLPDEADLNLEVFGSLLYGAKGIAYFTYLAPYIGNYRMAPLDQFHNKTAQWERLRYINKCIQALAPVLNKLESTAVYHFPADSDEYSGPDEKALIATIEGGNFAVGEFSHADHEKKYVMVQNKSLKASAQPRISFRNEPKTIQIVSKWRSGERYPFAGEQLWLGPGEAVLLEIE